MSRQRNQNLTNVWTAGPRFCTSFMDDSLQNFELISFESNQIEFKIWQKVKIFGRVSSSIKNFSAKKFKNFPNFFQLHMERQKCPVSTNKKHTISTIQHSKSQCNRLRSEPDIPKNNQLNWANSAETFNWRLLCWEHVMDIKQRADIDVHDQGPDNVEHSAVQGTQIRVFWGKDSLWCVFGDNIYWYWSLGWCCFPSNK